MNTNKNYNNPTEPGFEVMWLLLYDVVFVYYLFPIRLKAYLIVWKFDIILMGTGTSTGTAPNQTKGSSSSSFWFWSGLWYTCRASRRDGENVPSMHRSGTEMRCEERARGSDSEEKWQERGNNWLPVQSAMWDGRWIENEIEHAYFQISHIWCHNWAPGFWEGSSLFVFQSNGQNCQDTQYHSLSQFP